MRSAPYDRRDGETAASAARRFPVRLSFGALFVLMGTILLSLVPYGAHLGASPALEVGKSGVCIVRSVAYADVDLSYTAYLEELSGSVGLTTTQLVASVVGASSAATGMILAVETGQNWGNSAGEAVSNLIDAADYPDYSTLTPETQALWGSKENYDSAKFCSLMQAVGINEYDRWKDYKSSNGGKFTFDESAQARLRQLARIASNWANGLGVKFGELAEMVNKDKVAQFTGADGEQFTIVGENQSYWDAQFPDQVSVTESNIGWGKYNDRFTYNYILTASEPVYMFIKVTPNNPSAKFIVAISKGAFLVAYGNNQNTVPAPSASAKKRTAVGMGDYYIAGDGIGWSNTGEYTTNLPVNNYPYSLSTDLENKLNYQILNGIVTGSLEPDIPGYPTGEIPENQVVYFPDNGINSYTTWNNYTTPVEVKRPDNPFNPTPTTPEEYPYSSGTPQWESDTTANLDQLTHVNFEKLFPFCLIYDIRLFWDKLMTVRAENGLSTQAANDYEVLRIPGLPVDGLEGGMEFDLEPLRELLNAIKPAVFWLLLITMIMSVVNFWQRILTGG